MSTEHADLSGPDLAAGFPLDKLPEGALFTAHAFGRPLLVLRRGRDVHATSSHCTHYGGPLADGLLVGDTVRCPWHHACFSLRTGEALRAPARKPLHVWPVEIREGNVFVREPADPGDGATARTDGAAAARDVRSIVIVGAGAAGNAAAEMLRREGFRGSVTMISADDSLPYDRPNLSKEYLSGAAPEEWIPLRSAEFYDQHDIKVMLNARATAIDTKAKTVTLADARALPFDRLLLATGADPIHLTMPGGDLPHVHYLRTLGDSRRIIGAAAGAKTALVMGASFIGLEVAAALRLRGLTVHVVAPEAVPLAKIMGPELGAFVRGLHEQRGVIFHLENSATAIGASNVTLKSGEVIPADLVVIGVGVRPSLALAENAGLAMDRGVTVNEFLETSVPGIFAAGDIARWPDAHSGAPIRVEHWVVAERQGQTAAKNMLGVKQKFDAVPFFWSAHYDTSISYVGHADKWDAVSVEGDLAAGDATVTLRAGESALAVITVGRDLESLRAERAAERQVSD